MGVLEPTGEAFTGEVPATPPGVRDLGEDSGEEDLFAVDGDREAPSVFSYNHDLSFKHILPILPVKGHLDLLEDGVWKKQPPSGKKKYCSGCLEDVKRDLGKLVQVVETFKTERDAVKEENQSLKKEVEALKKLLEEKKEKENGDVKISIANNKEESVEILVKKKNFENAKTVFDKDVSKKNLANNIPTYGIQSFSMSLPKEDDIQRYDNRNRKTVNELRREFFSREFQSEQKTFTSRNFLEIKPEEKKETLRSRLNIRIKPKKKITEIISKLTSKFGGSKVIIPEAPQISMFQRFEKTRIVYQSDLENKVFT